MKDMQDRCQGWLNAITFAEAGEWDTARSMLPEPRQSLLAGWLDRMFLAVTYAEAEMVEEAVRYVAEAEKPEKALREFVSAKVSPFISLVERMGMAIAYAEEGEFDEAVRLASGKAAAKPSSDFLEAVGLRGARVTFGVMRLETVRTM